MRLVLRSGGLLAVLLLASAGARAVDTTWELQGRLIAAAGPGAPADFVPGTPFRVVVGFSTDATLDAAIPGTAGGMRYNYTSPMRFLIYLGTTCAPCEINDPYGQVYLRDNFSNLVGNPAAPEPAVDGVSLGVQDGPTSVGVVMRGPVLDIVNGPSIPVAPDPRLADLAVSVFQACEPFPGTPPNYGDACTTLELSADIDSVRRPSFGTGYNFTSRDCSVPTLTPPDGTRNDCNNRGNFYGTGARVQAWSFPGSLNTGGGVGSGAISHSFTPTVADIDASWQATDPGAYAINARAALTAANPSLQFDTTASLGSLFGSISFGGPLALPVVKGLAIPSAQSRTNTNLFAFQAYNYSGGVTSLPLVLDLTYQIADRSNDPTASVDIGNRPGGANIYAKLVVVDASVSLEQINAAGLGFGCNDEAGLGWPAGAILGVAEHYSASGEQGSQARTIEIRDCDDPAVPVQLAAGQDFTVAVALQTPARGRKAQPLSGGTDAPGDGFLDAANTLRVKFSADAPPELVQQLVADIAPSCEPDCDFPAIDIKPGDDANCIKIDSTGAIPVALLGTASFAVSDVVIGSLKLGKLSPAVLKNGKFQCGQSDVNLDGVADLVCHFRNSPANWTADQAIETLRGQAASGAFEASDKVCLQ